MKTIVKSREEDAYADASSSFSRLPDEIILQTLNKIFDFKSLCFCYLVSKRFSSIVLQVDTVSVTAPLLNPHIPKKLFRRFIKPLHHLRRMISASYRSRTPRTCMPSLHLKSYRSSVVCLKKFQAVRSLCIELPSSIDNDTSRLFKWKVKFGNKLESFIFLLPNSVCDKDGSYLNGNCDEEVVNELTNDMVKQNIDISMKCLADAFVCHKLMLKFVKCLPKLENISIASSGRRGGRVSVIGEKLRQVKEWVLSVSKTVMNRLELADFASFCYVPVLNLPVSGCVMKGVHLLVMDMRGIQGEYDGLVNSGDGFEDKEEAAYTEAMMEILEKHRGMMRRLIIELII